jgi:hypothetical protein
VYDRGITYSFLSKEISCARLKNKTYKLDRKVLPTVCYNSWGSLFSGHLEIENLESCGVGWDDVFSLWFVLYSPVLL